MPLYALSFLELTRIKSLEDQLRADSLLLSHSPTQGPLLIANPHTAHAEEFLSAA